MTTSESDETGHAIYAGGSFAISADGSVSTFVGKWQNKQWETLGSGVNGFVKAMAVYDDGSGDAVYAAGKFSEADGKPASNIARWNGSEWSSVGEGTDGEILALAVFDDGTGPALYATGRFDHAGGSPASNIARWDGSNWSPLAGGFTYTGPSLSQNRGRSLVVFNGPTGPMLIVGGFFDQVDGTPMKNIAAWNGSDWFSIGNGVDSRVDALAAHGNGEAAVLYAGVTGTTFDAPAVLSWNGITWNAVGTIKGSVSTLQVFGDSSDQTLYAGGNAFLTAFPSPVVPFSKWDGQQWLPLGQGANRNPVASVVFDDGNGPDLYFGGGMSFVLQATSGSSFEEIPSALLAKWDVCSRPDCSGDVTGDSSVNLDDLNLVLTNFGFDIENGDANGDGTVNLDDLNIVLSAFGTVCP